ncbi:MAG: hypothetical protein ABIT04_04025 [Novosphingobium sp.]
MRKLRGGCWLINVTPTGAAAESFDGTMRVDRGASGCTISGDLYRRPVLTAGTPPQSVLAAPPAPDGSVPIFPIAAYVQYLRVVAIDEHSSLRGVGLKFEAWRYRPGGGWTNRGTLSAAMLWVAAPAAYPEAGHYLEGDVRSAAGAIVARMRMGWIAPRLRRATVEIDAASGCERPVDNAAGYGWAELFDALNWDGEVVLSDANVQEPPGSVWSDAALHRAMIERRDRSDLNAEWRYHLLSVSRTQSAERGVMYDNGGSDANGVPREGCALAAAWPIPAKPPWGLAQGQRFGAAAAPFFRAAVHELGHAFGLDHNAQDLGFMNTTEVIAGAGTAARPFPTNIGWSFAPGDLARLRHWPDILVRPGGAPTHFGSPESASPLLADAHAEPEGLRLQVTPLLGELPVGAPVRINIALVNDGASVQRVPARISLKTEFVSGRVTDPSRTVRRFSTLIACVEDQSMRDLAPGERFAYDLTLLRGADGALFPQSGLYTVEVEVGWPVPPVRMCVAGSTTVFVTGARDASHAAAAHRALATPDLHLVLVIGGDHLQDGIGALAQTLDDDVLRPHYAAIEAKRRGATSAPSKRRGDPRLALRTEMIMSASEAAKLAPAPAKARAARGSSKRTPGRKRPAKTSRSNDGGATA